MRLLLLIFPNVHRFHDSDLGLVCLQDLRSDLDLQHRPRFSSIASYHNSLGLLRAVLDACVIHKLVSEPIHAGTQYLSIFGDLEPALFFTLRAPIPDFYYSTPASSSKAQSRHSFISLRAYLMTTLLFSLSEFILLPHVGHFPKSSQFGIRLLGMRSLLPPLHDI